MNFLDRKVDEAMKLHLELLSDHDRYIHAVNCSEAAFRLMLLLNRLVEHKRKSSLEISTDCDTFGYRAAIRRY